MSKKIQAELQAIRELIEQMRAESRRVTVKMPKIERRPSEFEREVAEHFRRFAEHRKEELRAEQQRHVDTHLAHVKLVDALRERIDTWRKVDDERQVPMLRNLCNVFADDLEDVIKKSGGAE